MFKITVVFRGLQFAICNFDVPKAKLAGA